MPSLLSVSLLAATAAAQITTSVWVPGSRSFHVGYEASVIAKNGNKTTLALNFDKDTDTSRLAAESIGPIIYTIAPNSWEVYTTTTLSPQGDYTEKTDCTRQADPDQAICAVSFNGRAAWAGYCQDHTETVSEVRKTYRYTDRASSVETVQVTYNPLTESYPAWCKSGTSLPESEAVSVLTVAASRLQMYPIVITAGVEKLGASAGATPTTTGPQVTGASSGSGTPTTGAASQQSTGAGVMVAPAFAGLGAAIAAYML